MQRLLDRDLLTALVLFSISAVFSVGSSADAKDWVFPLLANYIILAVAVILLARVVFTAVVKRASDFIRLTPEDRIVSIDVTIFLLIMLAYMLVMYGLGFWLSSLLMLSAASIYLTLDRTRRNIGLAIVVPVAFCAVAYFVFRHVFFVPLPSATWWAGVG